jgi:hypothetical protein
MGPTGPPGPAGALATFNAMAGMACTAPGNQPGTILITYPTPGVPRIWCRTGTGRYIVTAETVTDTETGLMWERKVDGGSGQSCLTNLHGVDANCTWEEAMGDWIDLLNGRLGDSSSTGYAGYNDWRVPTLAELKTIQSCSGSGGGQFSFYTCSVPAALQPTPNTAWSATTLRIQTTAAYTPPLSGNQNVSTVGGATKADPHHVRAVRGGP